MDKQKPFASSASWAIPAVALSLLTLGVIYYNLARSPELRPFFAHLGFPYDAGGRDYSGGTLPSFVHALALFVLLTFVLKASNASNRSKIMWFAVATAALISIETFFGTTTVLDTLAIVVAIPLALAIVGHFSISTLVNGAQNRWVPSALIGGFSMLGIASYTGGFGYEECARYDDEGRCVESVQYASPIYMSYDVLRSSVRLEDARPLDDVGRIYAFQNLLFINERNRGVHVIDNSDPFEPVTLRFINIPGNLDIEIRGDRLYADSFVDLVTLDISSSDSITEVDRKIDVFPWDENQNMPYNVRLEGRIDRDLGVVIAYEVN